MDDRFVRDAPGSGNSARSVRAISPPPARLADQPRMRSGIGGPPTIFQIPSTPPMLSRCYSRLSNNWLREAQSACRQFKSSIWERPRSERPAPCGPSRRRSAQPTPQPPLILRVGQLPGIIRCLPACRQFGTLQRCAAVGAVFRSGYCHSPELGHDDARSRDTSLLAWRRGPRRIGGAFSFGV